MNSGPYLETLPLEASRSRLEMVSVSVKMASLANLRRANERAASSLLPGTARERRPQIVRAAYTSAD